MPHGIWRLDAAGKVERESQDKAPVMLWHLIHKEAYIHTGANQRSSNIISDFSSGLPFSQNKVEEGGYGGYTAIAQISNSHRHYAAIHFFLP